MTIDDAIKHYGTPGKLAAAINVNPAAISNWKRRGNVIPASTQYQLQVLTKGRLKADQPDSKPAA